jgi:hypothetical protein
VNVCSDLLLHTFDIPAWKLHLAPFFYHASQMTVGPSFEQRQHFVSIGKYQPQN